MTSFLLGHFYALLKITGYHRSFVELSSARVRQQFETLTAQTKELAGFAQKVSTETAEPLKTELSGALNKVA